MFKERVVIFVQYWAPGRSGENNCELEINIVKEEECVLFHHRLQWWIYFAIETLVKDQRMVSSSPSHSECSSVSIFI